MICIPFVQRWIVLLVVIGVIVVILILIVIIGKFESNSAHE